MKFPNLEVRRLYTDFAVELFGLNTNQISSLLDIDECEATRNICHQYANCSNVLGSYVCHCTAGFSGDGKLNCDGI